MATKTRAELATRVLMDLGYVAAGETPDAADQQWVLDRWSDAAEELRTRGLVYWPDDAIPLSMLEPLTQYCKLIVGTSFGIPALYESLDTALKMVETRVRKQQAKETAGEPVESTYF